MNAKLTPEQAIEMMNEIRTIENINGYSYRQVELSPEEAEKIAALIESLAADAALGMVAVTGLGGFVDAIEACRGKYGTIECDFRREHVRNYWKQDCKWMDFCRLRAGSGGE